MANYEVESVDLAVNIAGEAAVTAQISDAQPLVVTIGKAAELSAEQAVMYIKSGKAEIQPLVDAAAESADNAATSETNAAQSEQNAADSATSAAAEADRAEAAADSMNIDNDTGLEHHYDVIDYYSWKEIATDNIYYTENYPPETGDALYQDVDGTITQYTTVNAYSSDLDRISWFDPGGGLPVPKFAGRDADEDITHEEAETSDGYIPTQKAVKTYVDNQIDGCATAAQGAKADTAIQPNDNVSELTNDAGYITSSALDPYALSADLATVATTGAYSDLSGTPNLASVATSGNYADLSNTPTIGNATLTIQKNSTNIDTFTANATSNKTINITVPVTAADVSALPSSTKYGASIDLSLNTTDYKLTLTLKDQDGTALNSKTVDFPIESVVVNGSYDSTNEKIVLTLQNGNTIDIPVGALISGLQTEITSQNKLDADLITDSTSTNKFVTSSEKSTWNGKQDAINDLSTIRSGASAGATAVQPTDLATVATTGAYSDLSGTPTIPTDTGDLTNGAGFITGITSSDVTTALGYTPYNSSNPAGYTSNVGTVTSVNNVSPVNGNVSLTIPAAQIQSDWTQITTTAVDYIKNKPTLATVATSGSYNDLSNKPTIPSDTSDLTNGAGYITSSALSGYATETWVGNQGYLTGITSSDVTTALGYTPYNSSNPNGYITNSALTPYVLSTSLATVATSGSYNDLSNKPTIPAAQVNSDWNAASGVAQILNKPTIPAAQVNSDWDANSGVAQILNKPTIPTVNNAILTITQGGTTKGTFTANASSDVTIALDAGGGGSYTAGDGIDITNNVISVDGEQTSELSIDTTPTQNSSNLITSGGVYAVLGDVEALINAL